EKDSPQRHQGHEGTQRLRLFLCGSLCTSCLCGELHAFLCVLCVSVVNRPLPPLSPPPLPALIAGSTKRSRSIGMKDWGQALKDSMITGAAATLASSAAVAWRGRRDSGSPLAPINATSHVFW